MRYGNLIGIECNPLETNYSSREFQHSNLVIFRYISSFSAELSEDILQNLREADLTSDVAVSFQNGGTEVLCVISG